MAQDNIQRYGDANVAVRDEIKEELLAAFQIYLGTGEIDDVVDLGDEASI